MKRLCATAESRVARSSRTDYSNFFSPNGSWCQNLVVTHKTDHSPTGQRTDRCKAASLVDALSASREMRVHNAATWVHTSCLCRWKLRIGVASYFPIRGVRVPQVALYNSSSLKRRHLKFRQASFDLLGNGNHMVHGNDKQ